MEQNSSWEASRFSFSQEIPLILWNPNVHYRLHKCPPPVPILSQFDPLHISSSHILKVHLNIILPSTSGSHKWSLSFRFPQQDPLYAFTFPHTRYMPRPSHSFRFTHPNNTGEEYRPFSSSLRSFLHSPVTSSLLGPNILLSTLFSNALGLRFSLNVNDQISHPYVRVPRINIHLPEDGSAVETMFEDNKRFLPVATSVALSIYTVR